MSNPFRRALGMSVKESWISVPLRAVSQASARSGVRIGVNSGGIAMLGAVVLGAA